MLWDIIHAAGFKFSPVTPIPFCTTWKEAPWQYYHCSSHEAEVEPDMVVSTLVFTLLGIFGFEESGSVNLKEGMQPVPDDSSVKVPKLTSCTSEKQPTPWKTEHYPWRQGQIPFNLITSFLPSLCTFSWKGYYSDNFCAWNCWAHVCSANIKHRCCSTNRWLKSFTDPVVEVLWITVE